MPSRDGGDGAPSWADGSVVSTLGDLRLFVVLRGKTRSSCGKVVTAPFGCGRVVQLAKLDA